MRASLALVLLLFSPLGWADKPAETPFDDPVAPESAEPVAGPATETMAPVVDDAVTTETTSPVSDNTPQIAPPTPFIAVYSARISAARGETTMTLMPADDTRYRFHSATEARGLARMLRSEPIVECSEFSMSRGGEWQAMTYTYRDGRKDSDIAFDFDRGVATTRYRDESGVLDVPSKTTDRLLEQLLISRAIANDEALSTRQVVDRGSLQTIEWQFVGKERVRVDAGSFETVKYRRQREGSKRSSLIWFAPALDGLPVRIEQYRLDDRQARAELKRYTDAATIQARGTVTPVCP
ncbi:MAG: DUF3108 domain-containing protein [Pseudomonadota bacterium]